MRSTPWLPLWTPLFADRNSPRTAASCRRGQRLRRAAGIEHLEDRLLLAAQVVSALPGTLAVAPGSPVSFNVSYETQTDAGAPSNQLSAGISLRMYFDSTKLTYSSLSSVLQDGLFAQTAVQADTNNGDANAATNQYVQIVWNKVTNNFPTGAFPVTLFAANFTAAANFSGSTVVDFTAQAAIGFAFAHNDITITAAIAPVLDLNGAAAGTGYASTFTPRGGPWAIVSPSLTVTDLDSTSLTKATATIANLKDGGSEVLAATTAGTPITASYGAGVLTLTGNATLAQYRQVLATLTYNNTASVPNAAARTINVVLNDGIISSTAATATVSFSPYAVLDVDGSGGEPNPFSDGDLILGYLFGLTDTQLQAFIAPGAARSPSAVRAYLDGLAANKTLDFDGNGQIASFTDGNLGMAHLFQLPDTSFQPFMGSGASRTVSQVRSSLNLLAQVVPTVLDTAAQAPTAKVLSVNTAVESPSVESGVATEAADPDWWPAGRKRRKN